MEGRVVSWEELTQGEPELVWKRPEPGLHELSVLKGALILLRARIQRQGLGWYTTAWVPERPVGQRWQPIGSPWPKLAEARRALVDAVRAELTRPGAVERAME